MTPRQGEEVRSVRRPAGRGEDGQVLLLAALCMVVLLGLTALAIDIGYLTRERRELQNDADAMALAGASQLTEGGGGHSAATAEAGIWAGKNGVDVASEVARMAFDVTCSGRSEPNSFTVELERSKPTFIARVIGIDEGTVRVCATGARYSHGGSIGAKPFGVDDNCVFGPDGVRGNGDDVMVPGSMITIKYDADNEAGAECGAGSGNFWTLAIDDTGAGEPCGTPPANDEDRKLKEAICYGAITPLCMQEAVTEGEVCETTIDTQTGNQIGAVRDSITYLVNNLPAACNTLAEVVRTTTVGSVTTYSLKDECNPFLPGYEHDLSLVMLIPVLDKLAGASGRTNIEIVDFMIVVLDPSQVGTGWCTGGDCDVEAQMVEAGANPRALRRALEDSSANSFAVLIE